jgi:Ca2+:H+ antiporter
MLGASFLLGGLKHHVQEYNRVGARFRAGLCSWPRSRS